MSITEENYNQLYELYHKNNDRAKSVIIKYMLYWGCKTDSIASRLRETEKKILGMLNVCCYMQVREKNGKLAFFNLIENKFI